MKKLRKIIKKITLLDWIVIGIVILALIFGSSFLFKEDKWVKVEMKLSSDQWYWQGQMAPPYWLADSLDVGDQSFDAWGRKNGEIVDLRIFEWGGTKKEVEIVLNLQVKVNNRKNQFLFNQKPLEVGESIDLELGQTKVSGLITFIEGIPDEREWVKKTVWVKIESEKPSVAKGIPIGGQMKDSQGRVLVEVLDKKIENAEQTSIITNRGELGLIYENPLKRDVLLKLEILAAKKGELFYFREGQTIKIGEYLSIQLPDVEIKGAFITEIIE